MKQANRILFRAGLVAFCLAAAGCAKWNFSETFPGYTPSPFFGEWTLEETAPWGGRTLINLPGDFSPRKPTALILYALPNGNTIEQTHGKRLRDGVHWRFDIQHIGAQTRLLRRAWPERNWVLIYLEAEGKSWPGWGRAKGAGAPREAVAIVDSFRARFADTQRRPPSLILAAHSGGGSLLFNFLNGSEAIPADVERIAFLDANYNFSDERQHGARLAAWLRASPAHALSVIAYDDRHITLDGKPVLKSPEGGTWGATQRMIASLGRDFPLEESAVGEFRVWRALGGRLDLRIHNNPENKILHTAMIGEMNGYLHALTSGSLAEGRIAPLGPPRAYEEFVEDEAPAAAAGEPAPTAPAPEGAAPAPAPDFRNPLAALPPRSPGAPGGRAFCERWAEAPFAEREAAIREEILRGNIPGFLRQFHEISVEATGIDGVRRAARYWVAPDYLAIGSDDDFVRMPMSPMCAQAIADALGCILPSTKMVDDIDARAEVKLEPQPLEEPRTTLARFAYHNGLIEQQRGERPLGALITGIKKDVVITKKLTSGKPNRVAIYGWRRLDGSPIQPLYTGHVNWYVDYSHGIRLVAGRALIDGKPMLLRDALANPHLCSLFSDEGEIPNPRADAGSEPPKTE